MSEFYNEVFIPYLEAENSKIPPVVSESEMDRAAYPQSYHPAAAAITQLRLEAERHTEFWGTNAPEDQKKHKETVHRWLSMPWWLLRSDLSRVTAATRGEDPTALDVELAKIEIPDQIPDIYLQSLRITQLLIDDPTGFTLIRQSLYGSLDKFHSPQWMVLAGLAFERYKKIYQQADPNSVVKKLLA